MKTVFYLIVVYALLIMLGGMIGFYKAGSLASLVMSSIFTALLLTSAFLTKRSFFLGFYTAFGLCLILSAFFAYRFFISHQLFPSGFMLLMSVLVSLKLLFTKVDTVRA